MDKSPAVNLQVENDFFAPVQTDRHYTNGLRLSYTSGDSPPALIGALQHIPLLMEPGRVVRWNAALGANMYTPIDTSKVQPDPEDRPYAGWAYVSGGLLSEKDCQLDVVELSLGLVGPSAQMEDVQKGWHRIIGAAEPQGWDSQLHDEPAVLLSWERKYRSAANIKMPFDLDLDVTPHVGVSLGNVLTAANAGMTLRLGWDLPSDYGPPRIRPSLPGTDYFRVSEKGLGWYFFAGVDGRAVAQNIFLDGNTYRDSPSIDKKSVVLDGQVGVAVHIDHVRLAYTLVHRSREYEGQPDPDMFAALTVTFRF